MENGMFDDLDTKTVANEGVEIEIMKPDGETSGLFVKVLGLDSDVYTKLRDKQERARMRAIAKGGRGAIDGIFDTSKVNEMDLIISCCIGWRHTNGKPMPFRLGPDGEDETRELFKKYPLLYEQVRQGISDRMNFMKTHATP